MTQIRGAAMAFVAIAIAGCGEHATQVRLDDEAPRLPGGSGSAVVTYQPDLKVIERRAGFEALIGVSTDGSTLVFDRSREAVPMLEAGDVRSGPADLDSFRGRDKWAPRV